MPHNPWTKVLVELRHQKRLTQEQAAEGAQVSKNTWYRWEKSNFNPSDKNLQKAADGLRCTIEDLQAAHKAAMPDASGAGATDPLAATQAELDSLRAGASMVDSMRWLLGEEVASDPLIERLLGSSPEDDPESTPDERFCELLDHVRGRTQILVAASTRILADILVCHAKLEDAASEEERVHLAQIYSDLLDHLKLSRKMTQSLQEIHSLRLASVEASLGEELPPEEG